MKILVTLLLIFLPFSVKASTTYTIGSSIVSEFTPKDNPTYICFVARPKFGESISITCIPKLKVNRYANSNH